MEVDESPGLGLFEGFGVELEYVLVGREQLEVRPISDRLLEAASGSVQAEIEMGELSWSNELVMHVIELKTNGPAPSLAPLAAYFQRDVGRMAELLAPLGATLLPTAMHPFMNPERETRLWPYDYGEVYRTFNRMFGCSGHGWSNLQSAHLNLPYQGDEEFGRLHAAIRMVLPLLPALAASSPVVEGKLSGSCDTRIDFYRNNCARIPVVTGRVIPEAVFTPAEYEARILEPIARAVEPYDSDEVLEPEWVNARGAIARLGRESIEIRVLDVQECPRADCSIIAAVTWLVRALVEERWCSFADQCQFSVERLERLFLAAARQGSVAQCDDGEYLAALGLTGSAQCARQVWEQLLAQARLEAPVDPEWVALYGRGGTLAERILARLGASPSRQQVAAVYRQLSEGLLAGRLFS